MDEIDILRNEAAGTSLSKSVVIVSFTEGFRYLHDLASLLDFGSARLILEQIIPSITRTHGFENATAFATKTAKSPFFNPKDLDGVDILITNLWLEVQREMTKVNLLDDNSMRGQWEFFDVMSYKLAIRPVTVSDEVASPFLSSRRPVA